MIEEILFTFDDITLLLQVLLVIPVLGLIITMLVNFIPSLMSSLLKKIKNTSIIYEQNSPTSLDKSELWITAFDKEKKQNERK